MSVPYPLGTGKKVCAVLTALDCIDSIAFSCRVCVCVRVRVRVRVCGVQRLGCASVYLSVLLGFERHRDAVLSEDPPGFFLGKSVFFILILDLK